ncbi:glycoside hydrolase family 114 protein [Piromyces sp. E2]|nr:glycoside hydrolase family 114 protein [Piromyces sp. E2]|eukprot:OUM60983.1 glycoside hydrolase family 114 protein [Piromyces sp. E2]
MQKSRKVDYDAYVNAGVQISNKSDWGNHYIDIRKKDKLQPLIRERMKRAVRFGCDAVEVDSIGLYNHLDDFKKEDTITFGKWLAQTGHEEGISVGMKNAAGCAEKLEPYFDFAVVESCAESTRVCDYYIPFTKHGKAVFTVHYGNRVSKFSDLGSPEKTLSHELGGRGFTCAFSIDQSLTVNSSNFDCSKGNYRSDVGSKPGNEKITTTRRTTTSTRKTTTTTTTRRTYTTTTTTTTTRRTTTTTTTTRTVKKTTSYVKPSVIYPTKRTISSKTLPNINQQPTSVKTIPKSIPNYSQQPTSVKTIPKTIPKSIIPTVKTISPSKTIPSFNPATKSDVPVISEAKYVPPVVPEANSEPAINSAVKSIPPVVPEANSEPAINSAAKSIPPVVPEANSEPSFNLGAKSVPPVTPDAKSVPPVTPDAKTIPSGTPDAKTIPSGTPDTKSVPPVSQSTKSVPSATPMTKGIPITDNKEAAEVENKKSGVRTTVAIVAAGGVATAAIAGFFFIKKNNKYSSKNLRY